MSGSAIAVRNGSEIAACCPTCGAFGFGCPCGGGFTQIAQPFLTRTLAHKLIKVADCLRDQYTRFGLRPYTVRIVRTMWTTDERGVGAEFVSGSLPILPTPLVSDLSSLQEVLQPVGLDEIGSIQISQISGRFTEDMLLGFDERGEQPAANEQVYYEIEFLRPNSPGAIRRFRIRSAPHYQADAFEWRVTLERSHEDRARSGDPR